MLASAFAAAIFTMIFAGDTPAARWLHRAFVEEPLRISARIERKHVIFLLIAIVSIQAFVMTLPADLALVAIWDVSSFVDVLIAVSTMSAMVRVRKFSAILRMQTNHVLRHVMGRKTSSRQGHRPKRKTIARKSANDDDPVMVISRLAA